MTKGIKRYFKDNLGIIAALVIMILFLYLFPRTHTTFLTKNNIFNVLRQSSTNLMLACGMTMVIILGGIDLSVGSIIAMSGVLGAAAVVWHGMPEVVGILIAILSGVIFGLLNGLVIAKTKIPPFIVTLASMNIAKGIAYVYSGGKPIRCMTDAWKFLGAGYVGGIPTPVITMFIVFVVAVLFLNRTRIGRHIYAVGGSDTAAKFSGISTATNVASSPTRTTSPRTKESRLERLCPSRRNINTPLQMRKNGVISNARNKTKNSIR